MGHDFDSMPEAQVRLYARHLQAAVDEYHRKLTTALNEYDRLLGAIQRVADEVSRLLPPR